MKKIPVKNSIKEKVCNTCGMQKHCRDLPGYCVLLFYVPIAVVIALLIYFAFTMDL